MTSQGDNSIVYTTKNGEKVAIPSGNTPSIGDKVLVHRMPDGTLVTHGNSSISVGDTVLVNRTRTGEYIAVKGGQTVITFSCVKVTDGFSRAVQYTGEIVTLGTFTFNWDGTSKVYLLKSCQSTPTNAVYADDNLIASTVLGSVSHNYGGLWRDPPLELSGILVKGSNNVTVTVQDLYGGNIGCTSLFLLPF